MNAVNYGRLPTVDWTGEPIFNLDPSFMFLFTQETNFIEIAFLNIIIYIYIYIHLFVCVCVREKEREGKIYWCVKIIALMKMEKKIILKYL